MCEEYGLKFVVNCEDYDKIKKSLNEQTEDLQQKVEQLEKENDDLKNKLDNEVAENTLRLKEVEQLENIRKEAIEWVVNHKEELHHSFDEPDWDYLLYGNATDLLNILNKGSEEDE